MNKRKVAITIEAPLLERIDRLVAQAAFPNRSQAIEQAVREQLERLETDRLGKECAKLHPAFEKAIAEKGVPLGLDAWPE
ncbi:MAG: ribbon-helix-helix domain-containing protein [Gammaproteobacteria bacterium]